MPFILALIYSILVHFPLGICVIFLFDFYLYFFQCEEPSSTTATHTKIYKTNKGLKYFILYNIHKCCNYCQWKWTFFFPQCHQTYNIKQGK